MKKIVLIELMTPIFLSCDPVSVMDANIKNLTSQNLTVIFFSSDSSFIKTLQIAPNETVLFQEDMDIGGSFLEPSLAGYDSVNIQNNSNKILKVYNPNIEGKNIYKVGDYWIFSELAKRVYKYDYKIENKDIE